MTVCAACGTENPARAKFCFECAAPLDDAQAERERRKTVTVLFCDVVGSTALGESVDPEAYRALLRRYFDRMKAVVEVYGGIVEKFIGDAVMCVFGIPLAHEDDALRACRAALEMRDEVHDLGLVGRIGVMTGEVVTGTTERLATGDAVNVAARLQQAAQPGEVLVGEPVLELVRDAVDVEATEPLLLKGKAVPVTAYRLRATRLAAGRSHTDRFVGRDRELVFIHDAWDRCRTRRACELVTIVGEAGIGKSRLVTEATRALDEPVVYGRCLPYGEGITYWPAVEVVQQLAKLPADPAAATAIRSLLGEVPAARSSEEIASAFRKLLEEAAPVVVIFDDIQWAEDTFCDLVEHVALLASDAAVLLLCLARPDLSERRPEWPVALQLDPLSDDEVEELVGATVRSDVRRSISRAAAGNPLFVAEMVAIAQESEGHVRVPPTLRALLASRLDQLTDGERHILECAAVEGEVFHRGAVRALAVEERQVTRHLAALVRKRLIRPQRATIAGEDGFRFRHLLIRDAAYESLPKLERATLHQRFADWLEQGTREILEFDDLAGYHLECSCRYRLELGASPDDVAELARRAADLLLAAGRRGLHRADAPAAVSLLSRANALLRADDPVRPALLLDLADALEQAGELERASAVLDDAIRAARATGDRRSELRALHERCDLESGTDPGRRSEAEIRRALESLVGELRALGDDWGAARACLSLADFQPRRSDQLRTFEQALAHARRSADERAEADCMIEIGISLVFGPTPVSEAIRQLEANLEWYRARDLRRSEAWGLAGLAHSFAMRAEFERARECLRLHRELVADLGQRHASAAFSWAAGAVERLAGDFAAVEEVMLPAYEQLAQMGDRARLSNFAAVLAEASFVRGRYDDAERWTEVSEEWAAAYAWDDASLWRLRKAELLARRGEFAEAERLVKEAVAPLRGGDWPIGLGIALDAHVEIAVLSGRTADAAAVARDALEVHLRKGNIAAAERTRARLDELVQLTHLSA